MPRKHNSRVWWPAWAFLGVGAADLATSGEALAQLTTGTLRGRITMSGAPAPANTARIEGAHLDSGYLVQATPGSGGAYTITGLRPGTYRFVVEVSGYDAVVREVRVGVGETVTLDVDVTEEMPIEEIVVTGRANLAAKTSEVGLNIDQAVINNLPQNNRNFLNFAALAPGIRISDDEFRKEFSSGGLGASQTNVFVDGVSLKNNVTQGGLVGQDASRGNPFPQLAVKEFRVLTQNFKAEYEQAGSAIITAVTRSGGNDFRGDVFGNFQSRTLVANDIFTERREEPKPAYKRYQFGGFVSGPIIKDQLHFFATYEGNIQDRANRVTLGTPTTENLERFGQYEGSFTSPFRGHLGFGKLSWQPDPANTVEVSVSIRRESDVRSFGGETSFETAENVRNNVYTTVLRHRYSGRAWQNEASFDFLHSQFNPVSLNPDLVGLEYQGAVRIGGRDTSQNILQKGFTVRDSVSLTDLWWLGAHLVKIGAKVSFQDYSVDRTLFGNPTFRFRDAPVDGLSFDVPFEAQYGVGDPVVSSDNWQFGLFVQDDWEVTDRLTINVGVRWDVETNPLNNDYVTPPQVRETAIAVAEQVRALNGPGFFDVENYLTDGSNRPVFLGAIQPRIGFSYDVFGDLGTVFFGGAGRYYDRTLFNTGVDERLRQQYAVRTFLFSEDGQPRGGAETIRWRPEYLSVNGLDALIESGTAPNPEIFLLENDTRPVRTDQLSLGVRQQVGPLNASVTYSHIRSAHGVGFYPANREATGDRNFLPVPNNFGNILISADDRASWYHGMYVTVEKPYRPNSPWGLSLAYTLAWAEHRGFDFNFDFPTIKDSPVVPTGNDERHRFVLAGIVGLPLGLKLSTLITLGTGTPYTIIDDREPGSSLNRVRHQAGRPPGGLNYRQVDLRLEWDYALVGDYRVRASVEAINIFNFANFADYDGNIPADGPSANPTFGQPRQITGPTARWQFGLAMGF